MKINQHKISTYFTRLTFFAVVAILGFSLLLARPVGAAVAHVGVATANNAGGTIALSISKPTTAVGDVMIALISVRGGSSVTITPPAGWTLINSANTTTVTTMKSSLYYKVVASGETGPYSFYFGTTARKASGIISSYSGVDSADPVNIDGVKANGSATAMTTPSVTTTVPNTMLIAAYSTATGTTMAVDSGMTLRGQDASTGSGAGSRTTSGLQDVLQPSAGATGQKTMNAGAAALNIGHIIALRPAPVISQVSYRLFQNTDSTTASAPYAVSGAPASVELATPFRLRIGLGTTAGGTDATNTVARTFKIQYALRGTDDVCDASFVSESYSDVTASSIVRFYDNPTPMNGASYVVSVNDPVRSGVSAVAQKYHESNPFSMAANIPAGQDGLWDVVLTTSGASLGKSYCLRLVDTRGTVLNGGYSSMAEFSIPAPAATQSSYRWYANADASTPGAPLAAQDTAATLATKTTPFRLRAMIRADNASLQPSMQNYKLQYAQKVGACDPVFSGESYVDFSTSASIMKYGSNAYGETDADPNTLQWQNEEYATGAPDDISAITGGLFFGLTKDTERIRFENFGFNIPTSSNILGLKVSVNANRNSGMSSASFQTLIRDSLENLYMHELGSTSLTGVSSTYNFGGSSVLWGRAWTPEEINNVNFGASIRGSLTDEGDGAFMEVDAVGITVYYTAPQTIKYKDNPSVASDAAIVASGNDPVDGVRPVVMQTYQEVEPFMIVNAIPAGQTGLWDFSLVANSTVAPGTYCFRIVQQNDSLLDSYTQIPELTIPAPSGSGPTLDQQLRGGQSVINGVKGGFTW